MTSYLANASLVLKSLDLSINATSNIGSCDAHITNMTWFNINIRTLLGDMYDKFDTFNLCLNSVTSSVGNTDFGTTDDDRNVLINVGGFPFLNQTYATVSGHNTNSTVMGSVFFQHSAITQYTFINSYATFGKNTDLLNINIFYTSIGTNKLPASPDAFPEVVFIFDIYGVEKHQDNNLSIK